MTQLKESLMGSGYKRDDKGHPRSREKFMEEGEVVCCYQDYSLHARNTMKVNLLYYITSILAYTTNMDYRPRFDPRAPGKF